MFPEVCPEDRQPEVPYVVDGRLDNPSGSFPLCVADDTPYTQEYICALYDDRMSSRAPYVELHMFSSLCLRLDGIYNSLALGHARQGFLMECGVQYGIRNIVLSPDHAPAHGRTDILEGSLHIAPFQADSCGILRGIAYSLSCVYHRQFLSGNRIWDGTFHTLLALGVESLVHKSVVYLLERHAQ